MKLPDALIICFSLFVHTELFDKRIKPWELLVLFLSEKTKTKKKKQIQERNSTQTDHLLPDTITTLHTLLPLAHYFVFSLFSL